MKRRIVAHQQMYKVMKRDTRTKEWKLMYSSNHEDSAWREADKLTGDVKIVYPDNSEKFLSEEARSTSEQDVKEFVSMEILNKMEDQAAAQVLRKILFDSTNQIDWGKAKDAIVTNMPEVLS